MSGIIELADEGDPYVDTRGNIIQEKRVEDKDLQPIEDKRKILPAFSQFSVVKETTLDNLPEPDKQQQSVIAAVIGLRLLGLDTVTIADVMGASLPQIQSIVKLPATQVTFEKLYQNVINVNSDLIQGRVASHMHRAVDTVVDLMNDIDTRDDVRLKAAQDILDRGGTNADQFFNDEVQSNQSDDELLITITNEKDKESKVTVDIKKK
jgi:hypothetical protein